MKYIYDVILNFGDIYIYDFYEWSKEDNIEYYKKIPIIRVNDKTFNNIKINALINDLDIIDSIYNITEIYDNKRISKINYVSIFTNGKNAIGLTLNNKGEIIMISKMLLDEEEETCEIGLTLKEKNIDINNNNQLFINNIYLTRSEYYKLSFLNIEINNLYKNKYIEKLQYLYYECFNIKDKDINNIYKRLINFINNEWSNKHNELYDLVRLSYSKK